MAGSVIEETAMNYAFKPREVAMLAQIVNRACAARGGCDEVTRATIASRIVAYAAPGERDFEKLFARALDIARSGIPECRRGASAKNNSEN